MNTNQQLKMVSEKQKSGADFENLAQDFLNQQGLTLLYQNWLQPSVGEIDLIMLEKGMVWDTLVFVEVRVRKTSIYGDAVTSVTKVKQKKIINTAKHFLQTHSEFSELDCRFDIVAYNISSNQAKHVTKKDHTASVSVDEKLNQPEWLQGAFTTNAW